MLSRLSPRYLAHLLILLYQRTLSSLFGNGCRYLPSCSRYTDEAILKYGLWIGGWMGFARICRCNPWGGSGLDFVPKDLPLNAVWYMPWRYARWRGVNHPDALVCEPCDTGGISNDKPDSR
ncbi:MAG: membrane protein insertion efficiency factor YidD [Methylobacteriaceae bacterium]|jgi:putative membrane protein insertion efficiency factor|nr:membrane protein insertion efficiency factor YidD [Methylobacteriaceae bacterium]